MDYHFHRLRAYVLAIAAMTFSSVAFGHSLDDNGGPTPPLRAYFEEIGILRQDLPNGVGVRGVLDQFKLWSLNAPITICFNNGDQNLREIFVNISQRWLRGTSLRFDFGSPASYRACSTDASVDIRISFNPANGHWSYIGTDSRRYKETTLNIGYAKVPPSVVDRKHLDEVILHEVGHAIGFEHEHQSPESKCEQEFDWPKVYHFAKTRWGWVKNGDVDKQAVDFNMRVLTSAERLRVTPYDRLSIMHYYFDPVLFKRGKNSPCFVGHNQALSKTDVRLAQEAYPVNIALQDNHLQKRAEVASATLAQMKLNGSQLARVGREVGKVVSATPRKIILDFDLARASGKPLKRGPGDFKPCEAPTPQRPDAEATVACEIATDASALLVAVEPR